MHCFFVKSRCPRLVLKQTAQKMPLIIKNGLIGTLSLILVSTRAPMSKILTTAINSDIYIYIYIQRRDCK